MKTINEYQAELKNSLIENGIDRRRAVECANFVLPRCTNSTLTVGFTPEAIINFMHKRLCTRAQPEIRKVAIAMKIEVQKYNQEFAKELVPHCKHLLWCPEGKMCCGAAPTKAEAYDRIYKEE
jgi:thymidylate synthase (FAD)